MIMNERGLTHRQIAEMAGCPTSSVNDWVGKDASVPHDLTRVSKLANSLGVSFQWLLLGEKPPAASYNLIELFDEQGDSLNGIYKITMTKLVPK